VKGLFGLFEPADSDPPELPEPLDPEPPKPLEPEPPDVAFAVASVEPAAPVDPDAEVAPTGPAATPGGCWPLEPPTPVRLVGVCDVPPRAGNAFGKPAARSDCPEVLVTVSVALCASAVDAPTAKTDPTHDTKTADTTRRRVEMTKRQA
jgi:hypothetical protein